MLFAIYYRSGDLCGNEDLYLAGYYEAESMELAQTEFPHGAFSGFRVEAVHPHSAAEIHARVADNIRRGHFR